MATFISTLRFTPQGIKNINDTCQRAEAFRAAADARGVRVEQIYWTLGRFDGLIVMDAPDEETATAVLLQLGSQGNVSTQTARAYDADEMQRVLGKLS